MDPSHQNTQKNQMSSSVFRSLRSIFTTKPSVAILASTTSTTITKPTTKTISKPKKLPKSPPNPKPSTDIPASTSLKSTTTTTSISKPKKLTKTPKTPKSPKRPRQLNEYQREVAKFKSFCKSRLFRVQPGPYEAIVRRLSLAGKYSYIEEIIEHQKKYENDLKKESFLVRLIGLYGKAKMFDHARKLFDEMPELNCDRTVLSFNALLTACLNSKKYETVRMLFRELPEKLSIEPDTVSYNIVVKGLCDTGSVDSAIEMIGAMEKDGHQPDLVTYNTIIHTLHQEKRLLDAEKIWEHMESKNIVPDVMSYNSKLRALCADKRVSEAVDLIGEMERKGVKPDIYTHNGLLHGFSQEKNLVKMKKWYGEMLNNNFIPDRVTYCLLVHCACDVGDFCFGYELSKEMLANKGIVTKGDLQRVLDGLVKELEVDKAEELAELVRSSYHLRFKLQLRTGK